MFISKQSNLQQESYINLLELVGALSNLFSDNSAPYLYYRVAENAFCKAFDADNLTRSDCSIDARKDKIGIGLKTFLEGNGRSFQKVAEFNRSRDLYREYENNPKKLVETISRLRNKRIEATKALFEVDKVIYHCVARLNSAVRIFEQSMDLINIDKLKITKESVNSVHFTDGLNEYNFNISKSTLLKRFVTKNFLEVKIEILNEPFNLLKSLIENNSTLFQPSISEDLKCVYLPLYSTKGGNHVPDKSGLNGWNAGGRKRKNREVYIPVPVWIHDVFEGFFPRVDRSFILHLPNKKTLSASMCQTARKGTKLGKSIMSKPNTDLGDWILDDVLKVAPGELVTYKMLEEVGIDSVEITKIDDNNFKIDFKDIGSYEEFKENYNAE